jgi:hypothetical protein
MLDVKGKRGLGYATHGVQQLGSRGCNIKFNIIFHPNYQLPFKIQTDTSGYGVGAILVQHQEGGEWVISYVVGF